MKNPGGAKSGFFIWLIERGKKSYNKRMKKLRVFLCIAVACMFVAAWTLCVNALSVPVFAVTRPMCIVLDAGHGGIDGGVVGRETGIKESDLNLSVTVKLKTILQQAGFDVVLTRKTEACLLYTSDAADE